MGYLYSSFARAYYFEDKLGYIKNGHFVPVEYSEEEFGRIIDKVIASKRAATVAAVLRKAILIYMDEKQIKVTRLEKRFGGTTVNQSSLYNKWVEQISNSQNFKESQIFALMAQKQQHEKRRKEREKIRICNMHYHEWISFKGGLDNDLCT